MAPRKYQKKPVVVEAWKVTYPHLAQIAQWCGGHVDPLKRGIKINTLEGTMLAEINDFVIKGVKGEFYPCKPDIFEATYEEAKDENTAS